MAHLPAVARVMPKQEHIASAHLLTPGGESKTAFSTAFTAQDVYLHHGEKSVRRS